MIKISHGRNSKAEYIPFNGSREEAQIFERELRGIADRSDPGFLDHLPEFKIAYKNKTSPASYRSLKYSLKHLEPFFGGYKMRHLTPLLIEQYKAKRLEDGVKKRTINIELFALSAYIDWINENLKMSVQKPKCFPSKSTKAPLPNVLSLEELVAVIDNMDGDVRLLVELMSICGLRKNEALPLTAENIDTSGGTVRILGKGSKWRIVPIGDQGIVDRLAELCKQRPTGPLFPSKRNPNKPRVDIRKSIWAAAKKANVSKHIYPHLFRHSFGAALVNGGADIRVIQELMGHAEVTTTQIYTQVAGGIKRNAVQGLVANVAKAKALNQKGNQGENL